PRRSPACTRSPYTTLFRSVGEDGAPVLLVGTNDARVVAFSSDGTHLWTRELGENEDNWATYVELMRVGDVDNDGELEIVVSLKTDRKSTRLNSSHVKRSYA